MKKYSYYGYEYHYNETTNIYHYESKKYGEILETTNERDITNYIDQERKPNNRVLKQNYLDCGFDIY